MIKLRCVVEHITYQNHENGWSVMKVKVEGYDNLVTLTGSLLDIPVGSVLLVDGDRRVDPKYGQLFVAQSWMEIMPATLYGIEKYLGSGLVKGILLGPNPLNKWGRPNSYFTNRIKTASELFHAGKVDYIIASGDNHTKEYDEPTAMRDSLMAHGVPEDRIILDFAGFRTLDSVVRAKEVFGCDSLTIISQADHNARALYLAEANGIEAVAISAPLRVGLWVRTRLAIREWLARNKMMLDIWFGKQPQFIGDKIELPDIVPQKSYSTSKDVSMCIVNQEELKFGIDSLVMEFENNSDKQKAFGDYYRIESRNRGQWKEVDYDVPNDGKEHLVTVFNSVAYFIEPHEKRQYVNYTSPYGKNLVPGDYRLVKYFGNDTAYVEFQIR